MYSICILEIANGILYVLDTNLSHWPAQPFLTIQFLKHILFSKHFHILLNSDKEVLLNINVSNCHCFFKSCSFNNTISKNVLILES